VTGAGLAVLLGSSQHSAGAEPDQKRIENPALLLQIVRLKPGESKRFELALPVEKDVPIKSAKGSGRSFLEVVDLSKVEPGQSPSANGTFIENDGKDVFRLRSGVEVVWAQDRPEIEIQASKDAKPGATNLRVQYRPFGSGYRVSAYVIGYRVVIQAD
jgi:hypothetical protein